MSGTVKWFDNQKGYGFIAGEDGTEYFVHHSAIVTQGREYRTLTAQEPVRFEVDRSSPKGLRAVEVVKG